jgi:hypothetical protein
METTFLSENSVTVTSARFVASGQTHAIGSITSVRILTEPAPIMGSVVLFGTAALAILFSISLRSWEAGAIGLTLGIAGYFVTKHTKATHIVVLRIASGEARAVFSQDRQFIQRIHDAVSNAIVARG